MSLARHTVRKTARLRGLLPAVLQVYLGGSVTGQSTLGTGTGTGLYSGYITLDIQTCIVDNSIYEMEIH